MAFLPRLRPDEMPKLYSAAGALVHPSLYEGGGLPVLEAMACGCPVACSSGPAVMEICGDAGVSLDGTKRGSMEDALMRIQLDDGLREWRAKRGIERVGPYRARPVVDKLMEAYRRASTIP